jgi:hypothetical protein
MLNVNAEKKWDVVSNRKKLQLEIMSKVINKEYALDGVVSFTSLSEELSSVYISM